MTEGQGSGLRQRSVLCPRVVGRDAEMAMLRDALEATGEGQGGVVFLVGEAGIGKSRLARALVDDAQGRGFTVLRGRAVQTATPVAYRPLAEALCARVRVGGAPEAPELVPFRSTLGRLVPEWRDEERGPADDSMVALAEGVLRFVRAVAEGRGCLIVLEDLHWADPESLAVVEYLADNLASEQALCLGTLRAEDHSPALDLARALEAKRVSQLMELSRLDEPTVTDMVGSCLNTSVVPDAVQRFAARADGVPFLVEELLATAVASGALVEDGESWTVSSSVEPVVPLTFADSVRRRLAAFDNEARAVIFAAAVLGRRFDWSLLARISNSSTDDVLDALHLAVEAQLVVAEASAGQFSFRHALTRDAVLAQLLPPERAAFSARALEVIEAVHPELADTWSELGAELAEAAGKRQQAASLLLRVGRDALDRGALESAEVALNRARVLVDVQIPAAIEVDESLTEVLSLAGKRDRAYEVTKTLLHSLGAGPENGARRAEAYLRLARAAIAATDWPGADEQLALARAGAAIKRDEHVGARIDALAAQVAMGEDHPHEAARLARTAFTTADRVGLPEVACEALEIVGRCARPHDLDEAETAFARAYRIAEDSGLTVWRARALHELGTIDLLRRGDLVRLHEARDLSESIGALATAALIDVQLAATLVMLGDAEATFAAAKRGAELARRYGLRLTFAAACAFEGIAHANAGAKGEAQGRFEAAIAHGGGDRGITAIVRTGEGILALVEEDRAAALRRLHEAANLEWRAPGPTGPSAGIWALVRAVDNPKRLAALTEAPAWWRPVHFGARAYCSYAEAVVLGRRRRPRDAARLVAEADAVLERCDWYRQFGRRLVAEAALDDGWGDPVAWLREALAFFEIRGHVHVASVCRSLLRRAGVPVPRRRDGSDAVPPRLRAMGVTAREMEVLGLVAEGLSNKEIGARLYLSPRTVERHIANLTAKTRVERRAQLVALAARVLSDTR